MVSSVKAALGQQQILLQIKFCPNVTIAMTLGHIVSSFSVFFAAFLMYIFILIYAFHLTVCTTSLQLFSDDLSIKKRSQIQVAFEVNSPVASE